MTNPWRIRELNGVSAAPTNAVTRVAKLLWIALTPTKRREARPAKRRRRSMATRSMNADFTAESSASVLGADDSMPFVCEERAVSE